MIQKVIDGIFISDRETVVSEIGRQQIGELNIRRVLTVSTFSINENLRLRGVDYRFLFMLDMHEQDILDSQIIEGALWLLEDSIRQGLNIVVHCECGVSRAPTIIIAYLMRQFRWSVEEALGYLQNIRPIADPNDSFIRQLRIFGSLNYKSDNKTLTTSSIFRSLCADTGKTTTPADLDNSTTGVSELFKCRRCRHVIFNNNNVTHHTLGNDNDYKIKCEYEYLLVPMKWMELNEYQGKIYCPKCKDKLGQFVWGGHICGGVEGQRCGAHVSPWIHIQKCRIDRCEYSAT